MDETSAPNAETLAAFAEIESGNGSIFDCSTEEAFALILSEQNAPVEGYLFPMMWAPKDKLVLYCTVDVGETHRGCIDSVTPHKVWLSDLNYYRPLAHFSGWRLLPDPSTDTSCSVDLSRCPGLQEILNAATLVSNRGRA